MTTRHDVDLDGRTVLITGAARGIGAATARRLHAKGASVALVGLEPDRLEELRDELGDRSAVFEADVTSTKALDRAVRGTVRSFGGIDVAIANAGLVFLDAIADAPIEHIRRTIDVNLLGVIHTDRAVLPHLTARRGYLLNVASLAAMSHGPLMGAYAASKAGVEAVTDTLRIEMRSSGVGVGCAYFGAIDTDLVRGGMEHPAVRTLFDLLPERIARPARVESAAAVIEDAIARRASRVWAPRYVGPALLLRGIAQPLTEWLFARSGLTVQDAIAAAHEDVAPEQDLSLGAAVTGLAR
jgi:NAD(P)-dependent dehydrogenase (short-subunit alcohol dehydrogenase family)